MWTTKAFVFAISLTLAVGYNVSTSDCNVNYGCYSVPVNCTTNCDYLVKWKGSGDSVYFILNFDVDSSIQAQYMSVGFSYDSRMNNDSVVMCKRLMDGSYAVHSYYNGRRSTSMVNSSDPTVGISQATASMDNSTFYCAFKRLKRISSLPNLFFDLNASYFIIVAHGPLNSNNTPMYHTRLQRMAGAYPIDFQSDAFSNLPEFTSSYEVFLKIHGIFMSTTWTFLAPTGILVARYYKYLFEERTICGIHLWFHIHRPAMLSCMATSVTAFVLVLAYKGWTWVDVEWSPNFFHSVIGSLVILLAFMQNSAWLRPHKDSPRRKYFNYAHRTIGLSTFTSASANAFLGIYLYFDQFYWAIVVGWYGWIVIIVVCLEYLDQSLKTIVSDVNVPDNKKKSIRNVKSLLLLAHLIVSVGTTVTLAFLIGQN